MQPAAPSIVDNFLKQTGRLVVLRAGKYAGKQAAISEIISQSKVGTHVALGWDISLTIEGTCRRTQHNPRECRPPPRRSPK